MNDKIIVKGRHCEFEIDPSDYPNLRFCTEASVPVRPVSRFEIPLPKSEGGICRAITPEEAFEFFSK